MVNSFFLEAEKVAQNCTFEYIDTDKTPLAVRWMKDDKVKEEKEETKTEKLDQSKEEPMEVSVTYKYMDTLTNKFI